MIWTKRIALVVAAAFLPPVAAAQTPSWCGAGPLNAAEATICITPFLGQLDQGLNEAYRAAEQVQGNVDQDAWLARRNACGMDIACIESAYLSRTDELLGMAQGNPPTFPDRAPQPATGGPPDIDDMLPRPWCDAGALNPTERTICADKQLSRLDAILEYAYGRETARQGDASQVEWLRDERDRCDTQRLCIALAYSVRLGSLSEAREIETERQFDVRIPPGHYPPPGYCRAWFPGRPPGQQPMPTPCDVPVPEGAVQVRG